LDCALLDNLSSQHSIVIAETRLELCTAYRYAGHFRLAREEGETALQIAPAGSDLQDRIRIQLAVVYRRIGFTSLAHDLTEVLLAKSAKLSVEVKADAEQTMGNLLLEHQPRKAAEHYRHSLVLQKV
jgi:Tfp pilus assembly protein PilF